MYGAFSYGSVPYGDGGGVEAFDVDAMLSGSRDELVYTAELTVWEIGGSAETKLYLGSAEWASAPTDQPGSRPFDGRLTTVLQWSRSIIGDRLGIDYQSTDATITFLNGDGAYDDIVDGYTIDGREVVVRVGRKRDPFADHHVIFRGVGVDWSADTDTVTVTARDKSFLLDVPASPNTYQVAVDGYGDDSVEGKRKLLSWGSVDYVTPVLVDPTNLVYQAHDGVCGKIDVSDRGFLLADDGDYVDYSALVAASITAGRSATCEAEGLFRLASSPDGQIFAQVRTSPNRNFRPLLEQIIGFAADAAELNIDTASFDALPWQGPDQEMGYVISPSDSVTLGDVLKDIMAGVNGWACFSRAGKLTVDVFTSPSGTPLASFARAEGDIVDLRRERLPDGVWPPPWRWRVSYNWRFTIFEDFAGGVPAGLRALLSEPYDLALAEDDDVLTDHPSAREPPPVECRLVVAVEAQSIADDIFALYTSGYRLYRVTLGRRALLLNLGDLISVTWPRFGLDAGKLMRVVAIDDRIDLSDGSGVETIEVVAFG